MIKSYSYATDENKIFSLYQKHYGELWPLDTDTFYTILDFSKSTFKKSFTFTSHNELGGFIVTQISSENIASILCLVFDPTKSYVGEKLLQTALDYFEKKKVKKIQLSSGGSNYLWPGIPSNLPHLIDFYKQHGWEFYEKSYDIILYLDKYKTPDFVYERINQLGVTLRVAEPSMYDEILEFEKTYFPEWYTYYKQLAEKNETHNVVYASDKNGEILGTVISSSNRNTWHLLLGEKVGTLGALGVKDSAQNKGIGMALASYVTEVHKSNNLKSCIVGYTWLVDWYGKLGYTIWREYEMSWRDV